MVKLKIMENQQKKRYIVHVDMDAFFASCEQRDNPALRGRPVIVGSDPKKGKGRGVVSACSYEARACGIHSAMPISIAYYKCPDGVFLPVDMSKYADSSRKVFNVLENFTPDIEPISIDEAFMDITGSYRHFGSLLDACRKIKKTIKERTGLTASLGMAPNKMTAKIASDMDKPDGLVIVEHGRVLDFLHPLVVGKLWGVGIKTKEAFKKAGIYTIGDLAKQTKNDLIKVFGKNGEHLWFLANGIDPREVEADDTVKSISNEYTFEQDVNDKDTIKDVLMFLCEKVSAGLRQKGLKARTISMKIRFSDFKTYTRAVTLEVPTNFINVIYENVLYKLDEFNVKRNPVRLIGVRTSNLLENLWKTDLFEDDGVQIKKESIHKAIDRISGKFGEQKLGYRNPS
ncbi:MAG: DNA polymerase IV [Candidatus Omnitrophota bacterium]